MTAATENAANTVPRPRIPRAIWALGFVSLFTDLGSEMVHGLLPVLLVGSLVASALMLGLTEGAAKALVRGTKVFSGYLSDGLGKRKPLVLLGYAMAAIATAATLQLWQSNRDVRRSPDHRCKGSTPCDETASSGACTRKSEDVVRQGRRPRPAER